MKVNEVKEKVNGKLPVKVLQMGEGNFLRAFADWMIDLANNKNVFNGSVVLCQPIERGMAKQINDQNGVYTVLQRGIENKEVVNRSHVVTSVSKCINPYEDFDELMEIAKSEDLKVVISNTTEAGIAYHEGDKLTDAPPASFPAKVTRILYERYKKFNGDKDHGLLFLPVELIEHNGDNLKKYVLVYAEEWGLGEDFKTWILNSNHFSNTLVDRIVTGFPKEEIGKICNELGYDDNILVTCEPFNLWVIEAPEKWRSVLPFDKAGLHVIFSDDITPYKTRKVKILNGAHTVSVLAAYLCGFDIVRDMVNDSLFNTYLKKCIWNEIIPTISLPENEMDEFANAVLERFANPFIRHKLLDISLNSVSKYKARCLTSLLDYKEKTGRLPVVLPFGLAALIAFYKGTMKDGRYYGTRGSDTYEIRDDAEVLKFFEEAWKSKENIAEKVLKNESFWGQDLTKVEGLKELVSKYMDSIINNGMEKAIKNLMEEI